MINQSETINPEKIGFDGNKYINLQKNQIIDRVSKFSGRLYLEIGGKFMYDAHASRVLPGFDPESKRIIFSSFKDTAEILFCVNANDIVNNRQLSNEDIGYTQFVFDMLNDIKTGIGIKPYIVLNMVHKNDIRPQVAKFITEATNKGFDVYKRYFISKYNDADFVISEQGYGQDEHIPLHKNLILVTGAASNSGKMSTCLGQIYLDHQKEIKSGYAKYETFPIWNLPLEHPVNLAYEAATADIGDYNCIDTYHLKAYKQQSVNYNRDVQAFEIVMGIAKKIVSRKNYMRTYKSPTDMGISTAGFSISDDKVVCIASLEEIKRRKQRYQQMLDRGEGEQKWIDRCTELENKAKEYIQSKYNLY